MKILRWIRFLRRNCKDTGSLSEELALHVQERTAEQEEAQEAWISRYWLEFWQDLRYGARGLGAHPTFTLAAVSALVLGIGVNASVFNVYKSLTSETWAIRDPQSTVQLLWQRGEAGRWLGFSWPHFRYLQANAQTMQGLTAEIGVDARVTQGDSTWDAEVGTVSANYMDLLAPRFALGHGFTAGADDISQPASEVVLSYDTWRTRFGRDPHVIGTRIDLDRHRFQVIGVAPPRFNGAAVTETDLWVGAAWGDILQPGRQLLNPDFRFRSGTVPTGSFVAP